jgi:hypothetical protein
MSQNSSQNDFSDEPLLSLPVTPSSQRYQVLDEHVDEYVLEPVLSPPVTPSRRKNQVFDELIRLLNEDEKLVRAVTMPHCYSKEFAVDRLILPDGTDTPYVIFRHAACLDKPFKQKVTSRNWNMIIKLQVFVGVATNRKIGSNTKAAKYFIERHCSANHATEATKLEDILDAAADAVATEGLPLNHFSTKGMKKFCAAANQLIADGISAYTIEKHLR